ncbi:unnamed protein product [Echinostoma caproni]|uniref:Uncharacterized protein n=1 Tax=Echinostoma caproni TaxID=27848 RepID=A0A183A0J6_9TREM|nr:unnamed protein product [Echinostoma caproni]
MTEKGSGSPMPTAAASIPPPAQPASLPNTRLYAQTAAAELVLSSAKMGSAKSCRPAKRTQITTNPGPVIRLLKASV